MQKISRRSFLKATAAAGVASASLKFSLSDFAKAAEDAPVEKRHTLCNGCSNLCGLFVHVKNGRVWKAEGNPIHLKNRGKICARGHGMVADIYNPDRVTRPMTRVGENKFEPISWEQAFAEIGEQLMDIVDRYTADSLVWM